MATAMAVVVAAIAIPGSVAASAVSGAGVGRPNTLVALGGAPQSAFEDGRFVSPLLVGVEDQNAAALPNVAVRFRVVSGAANFQGRDAVTVRTDRRGVATAPTLLAGSSSGPVSVAASVANVAAALPFSLRVVRAGLSQPRAVGAPSVAIPATTKVLTAADLVDASVTPTSIVLRTTRVPLKPGDVAVAGRNPTTPEGLLRRVTSVSTGGDGTMTVRTTSAAMQDAISGGAFVTGVDLGDLNGAVVHGLSNLGTRDTHLIASPAVKLPFPTGHLGLDVFVCRNTKTHAVAVVDNGKKCPKGADEIAHSSGSIDLSGTASISASFNPLSPSLTFSSDPQLKVSSATHVQLLDKTYKFDKKFFDIKYRPIPVVILGVPIGVITPEFYGDLNGTLTAKAGLDLTASFGLKSQASLTVKARSGSAVAKTSFEPSFKKPALTLSADLDAKLGIAPGFQFLVDGVVGPNLALGGFVHGHVGLTANPRCEIDGGITFKIGIDLGPFLRKIPGLKKADPSKTFEPYHKVLYTCPSSGVPGAPTKVVGAPGDGSVALSWTAPASNGGSAISGYSYRSSTDAGTTWSSSVTAGLATSTVVTNLTPGVPYVFQVAAKNSHGTGAWSVSSAPVTPGSGTDVWPIHDQEGSLALYAYFGAELYVPDWVSCSANYCIAGDGDVVRLYQLNGIDDLGSIPLATADPRDVFINDGVPTADVDAFMLSGPPPGS
jgi:hypothetical protein